MPAADLASQYEEQRRHLIAIAGKLGETIEHLCSRQSGFVFATQRVKEVKSFVDKAEELDAVTNELRYPEPFVDIHDQIGCRVVVRGTRSVSLIRRTLQERFDAYDIDPKRPEDPGLFGYAALHMDSPVPEGLLGNPPKVVSTRFEIQIATLYQYAWTEMNHALYKRKESPLRYEVRRLIAAAAALSMTADELFERALAPEPPGVEQIGR